MNDNNVGDRECPECEKMSLIEKGITQWVCLNCSEVFDEKFPDDIEE